MEKHKVGNETRECACVGGSRGRGESGGFTEDRFEKALRKLRGELCVHLEKEGSRQRQLQVQSH